MSLQKILKISREQKRLRYVWPLAAGFIALGNFYGMDVSVYGACAALCVSSGLNVLWLKSEQFDEAVEALIKEKIASHIASMNNQDSL